MANPNIVNVTSILGKTQSFALTTTTTTSLVANSASSGQIYKINSIYVANIDGTNSADATVTFNDGSNTRAIVSTVAVPADATLTVLDKNTSIYLEEGQSIEGGASANSDLVCIISYEILS